MELHPPFSMKLRQILHIVSYIELLTSFRDTLTSDESTIAS
jgi:hypothetical protein